jgi:hypothetical protein
MEASDGRGNASKRSRNSFEESKSSGNAANRSRSIEMDNDDSDEEIRNVIRPRTRRHHITEDDNEEDVRDIPELVGHDDDADNVLSKLQERVEKLSGQMPQLALGVNQELKLAVDSLRPAMDDDHQHVVTFLGQTGVGKSFIINHNLRLTEKNQSFYTRVATRRIEDGVLEYRHLPSSDTFVEHALAPGSNLDDDDTSLSFIQNYDDKEESSKDGDIKAFLLPSARPDGTNCGVTTSFCSRLQYGSAYQLVVSYYSKEDILSQLEALFDKSDEASETSFAISMHTAHALMKSSTISTFISKNIGCDEEKFHDVARVNKKLLEGIDGWKDILDQHDDIDNTVWDCIGSTHVWCGNGESKDFDRIYIRDRLNELCNHPRLRYFIRSVRIFAPCDCLQGVTWVDAPGCNDSDPKNIDALSNAIDESTIVVAIDQMPNFQGSPIKDPIYSGKTGYEFWENLARDPTKFKFLYMKYDESRSGAAVFSQKLLDDNGKELQALGEKANACSNQSKGLIRELFFHLRLKTIPQIVPNRTNKAKEDADEMMKGVIACHYRPLLFGSLLYSVNAKRRIVKSFGMSAWDDLMEFTNGYTLLGLADHTSQIVPFKHVRAVRDAFQAFKDSPFACVVTEEQRKTLRRLLSDDDVKLLEVQALRQKEKLDNDGIASDDNIMERIKLQHRRIFPQFVDDMFKVHFHSQLDGSIEQIVASLDVEVEKISSHNLLNTLKLKAPSNDLNLGSIIFDGLEPIIANTLEHMSSGLTPDGDHGIYDVWMNDVRSILKEAIVTPYTTRSTRSNATVTEPLRKLVSDEFDSLWSSSSVGCGVLRKEFFQVGQKKMSDAMSVLRATITKCKMKIVKMVKKKMPNGRERIKMRSNKVLLVEKLKEAVRQVLLKNAESIMVEEFTDLTTSKADIVVSLACERTKKPSRRIFKRYASSQFDGFFKTLVSRFLNMVGESDEEDMNLILQDVRQFVDEAISTCDSFLDRQREMSVQDFGKKRAISLTCLGGSLDLHRGKVPRHHYKLRQVVLSEGRWRTGEENLPLVTFPDNDLYQLPTTLTNLRYEVTGTADKDLYCALLHAIFDGRGDLADLRCVIVGHLLEKIGPDEDKFLKSTAAHSKIEHRSLQEWINGTIDGKVRGCASVLHLLVQIFCDVEFQVWVPGIGSPFRFFRYYNPPRNPTYTYLLWCTGPNSFEVINKRSVCFQVDAAVDSVASPSRAAATPASRSQPAPQVPARKISVVVFDTIALMRYFAFYNNSIESRRHVDTRQLLEIHVPFVCKEELKEMRDVGSKSHSSNKRFHYNFSNKGDADRTDFAKHCLGLLNSTDDPDPLIKAQEKKDCKQLLLKVELKNPSVTDVASKRDLSVIYYAGERYNERTIAGENRFKEIIVVRGDDSPACTAIYDSHATIEFGLKVKTYGEFMAWLRE